MQSSAPGRSNNQHPHGLGTDWPSNCPVKKELGVTYRLAKQFMSYLCALTANPNCTAGSVRGSVASRLWGEHNSTLLRLHLEQSWNGRLHERYES